jgi:hypothetical protein
MNINICSIVEHSEPHTYLVNEIKRVLTPLGLYSCMNNFTMCFGVNFICNKTKIHELFNYIKNIVVTSQVEAQASERYMGRIIYELNNHSTFNIDGYMYDNLYNSGAKSELLRFPFFRSNLDINDTSLYFQRIHKQKHA